MRRPGWVLREHSPGGVRYADRAGFVAVPEAQVVGNTVSVPALGWEAQLRPPSERMLGQVAPDVHGRHHGNGPWWGRDIEHAGDVFLGYHPTATEDDFRAAEGMLLDAIPGMRPESAPQVMAPRPFQLPDGEVPWLGGDEKEGRNLIRATGADTGTAAALPSDDEEEGGGSEWRRRSNTPSPALSPESLGLLARPFCATKAPRPPRKSHKTLTQAHTDQEARPAPPW